MLNLNCATSRIVCILSNILQLLQCCRSEYCKLEVKHKYKKHKKTTKEWKTTGCQITHRSSTSVLHRHLDVTVNIRIYVWKKSSEPDFTPRGVERAHGAQTEDQASLLLEYAST